ncbi:MAG TPA: MBL fold metallo-hydrolase [Ktedonobacterales bacterium]|nr:MBL fold metallo-hydrolase [Ktedonobacterales bacterium]
MEQQIGLIEVPNGGWDERVRLFRGGQEVDTCVVVTRRCLIVVDTMATPELAAAIMEAVSDALAGRQLLVINTHADYDHCWGNAVFESPGGRYPAPILAHDLARKRMRSEEARQSLARRQQEHQRFANVRLVEPTITCSDAMTIDGGDLTLELLPTPGHTEDHLSIWIPELKLLLAGDAAEHPFPYVEEAATLPILLNSLERLANLHPDRVIPCHGGPSDAALISRNLAYFAEAERRVRSALASGLVPSDWRERDDVPELINFSFEEGVQIAGGPSAGVPAFYRGFHLAALRATLTNVQA